MKLANTFTGLRNQLMGANIKSESGNGRVIRMESHLTNKAIIWAESPDGHGFVTFPQWITAVEIEVQEVIGYALEIDEILARK